MTSRHRRRAELVMLSATCLALFACAGPAIPRPSNTRPQSPGVAPVEGFVTADDGLRLFYRQVGSGAQTVIVPASLFLYRDLSALASGRRMIFYDMRGRGRSDRVADSTHITIQWDVRDLETVRRHFGVERFAPIGWSYLGLMVTMYAADHPDRVERVAEIGLLRQSEIATQNPMAHCRRELELTRAALVGDPRLADKVPDVCEYENEWPANFGRHMQNQFVGSIVPLDIPWTTFAKITMPVLTIHGTHDRNAPYGSGREWVSHLPNARLLTVPGAAHMPWIDQPALVFGALDRFLKGDWPPEARPVANPAAPNY